MRGGEIVAGAEFDLAVGERAGRHLHGAVGPQRFFPERLDVGHRAGLVDDLRRIQQVQRSSGGAC